MAMLRTVECDIKGCTRRYTEREPGAGFPGWGQIRGAVLNGSAEPMLCPGCFSLLRQSITNIERERADNAVD